jgi:hypothetical protein
MAPCEDAGEEPPALAGYAGIFVGGAISGPLLNAPDYLRVVYPNRIKVIVGMLL